MTSTLMIQGTTSDAGKSTLVAALGRIFSRRQHAVVPFKPQNMALNSAVTEDGGEIGRAQALQAMACGLPPHSDMNPVLIKPSSDTAAQIIIHGRALQNMEAGQFHNYKKVAMDAVLESYHRLSRRYDTIVVEGAGSPAEINLRQGDIANMGFAEAVDCPVLLVADIDKGGVFAHIVGTLELLSATERQRIVGFIINKFRGDIALLEPGLRWLEAKTGKPVLGVMPYLQEFYLDSEDAIDQQQILAGAISQQATPLQVIVPVFKRISNHTDFDSLRLHPEVNLTYVAQGQKPPAADLIILPGSKNVRQDLQWLRDNNWHTHIEKHLRYGGKILGICGGYQMLGKLITDPQGIEGPPGESQGLGYFAMRTELHAEKTLTNIVGTMELDGITSAAAGYEIHNGISCFEESYTPLVSWPGSHDGAVSGDHNIIGTYLHGLLDHPESLASLLRWSGLRSSATIDLADIREQQIERLANEVEQHCRVDLIENIMRSWPQSRPQADGKPHLSPFGLGG